MCEALLSVEEEGLDKRWARHQRNHHALARGLAAIGLDLLPPPRERFWTLNAVRVPAGIDEAAVGGVRCGAGGSHDQRDGGQRRLHGTSLYGGDDLFGGRRER